VSSFISIRRQQGIDAFYLFSASIPFFKLISGNIMFRRIGLSILAYTFLLMVSREQVSACPLQLSRFIPPTLISTVALLEPDSIVLRRPDALSISPNTGVVVVYDNIHQRASAFFFDIKTGAYKYVLDPEKTEFLYDSTARLYSTSSCSPYLQPLGDVLSYRVVNTRFVEEQTGEKLDLFRSIMKNSFIGGVFVGDKLYMKCMSPLFFVMRRYRDGARRNNVADSLAIDSTTISTDAEMIVEFNMKSMSIEAVRPVFMPDFYYGPPMKSAPYFSFQGAPRLIVNPSTNEIYSQVLNSRAIENKLFSECANIIAYNLSDCSMRNVSLAPRLGKDDERFYPDADEYSALQFAQDANTKRFYYIYDRGAGIYNDRGEKTPVGISRTSIASSLQSVQCESAQSKDSLVAHSTFAIFHKEMRVDSNGFTVLSHLSIQPEGKSQVSKNTIWCLQRYNVDGSVRSIHTQPIMKSGRRVHTSILSEDGRRVYCLYMNKSTERWELDTYEVAE
jgi:hypothetical protein